MKFVISALILVLGNVSLALYAPFPPTFYRSPFPPDSTAAFPVNTVVNYPENTPVFYPAGANVRYMAPTTVMYPRPTRCYYPTGPATYPPNVPVNYTAGSNVVYPPGTELIMLDNTTSTVQPINNNQYGLTGYPNGTTCMYYNNTAPPNYYPPGTPPNNYYVPGGVNQYGQCPPPVGYTQMYNGPYNQPFYRTCSGYDGRSGYPMYQTGPYMG